MPDGTYNFIGNTIELLSGPQRSRSDLERLAGILRSARGRGASADEIREQVRKEVPELMSIADLLPKTRKDVYAFVGIILAILTLVLNAIQHGNEPKIEINQVINQITQTAPAAPPPPSVGRDDPARKVGRNDPCPCGSGKKYKRCHALKR